MSPFKPGAALGRALLLAGLAWPTLARAEEPAPPGDILVVADKQAQAIEGVPATVASIDAARIATTVNAVNVEDALKYLPSLLIRKRHIGDTQAPLATRTSGLGSSARSLIYADGALLSALIGNNNTSASPRWSLVSPQEIARIDVLYGPFSAAYPGNSIGAVVNITTRLPDRLEATVTAGTNVQTFDQYGTHATLPSWQTGATIGDRFGPLALLASFDHVDSKGQPLLYVTANQPSTAAATGTPVTGAYSVLGRTGQPVALFGASGIEHQRQDRVKLKAALDLSDAVRLTYVGGLFLNDDDAHADTYLRDSSGQPVYAGAINAGGRAYTLAPSAFSGGVYSYEERHWSHAVSLTGSADRLDWQVTGTLYDFAHDVQRIPTTALPSAADGGAGTITRLDGSGWKTIDAKAAWKMDEAGANTLSAGAHGDWFVIRSNRYATTDWISGGEGALTLQSRGRTSTYALWAQDAWKFAPGFLLTVGGRYEWWRAYDGVNYSLSPLIGPIAQPALSAHRFSPKVSLAWTPDAAWTVRASFGEAWRFPTVGELYQIVTTPVPSVPNPNLKPERALSEELAIERHIDRGTIRLSVFNEAVKDALISQTGPLAGTAQLGTYVQNVDRTRARGVELAFDRTDLLPRIDVQGSVTYADAETRKDVAFPAAVGHLLPQVPRWRVTAVATWRPIDRLSLTAAMRYSSRNYGTLDNSDSVGNTFTGFYRYLVADLRASFAVNAHLTASVGIDNVNNDRYFLYHPFPQRSYAAELHYRW